MKTVMKSLMKKGLIKHKTGFLIYVGRNFHSSLKNCRKFTKTGRYLFYTTWTVLKRTLQKT